MIRSMMGLPKLVKFNLRAIHTRLLPETIKGQMLRGQLEMSPRVADAINDKIMSVHLPNNLRRVVQHMYVKLGESVTIPPPKNELHTDAFIAAFFLRDYAATYQVLHELKTKWNEPSFHPNAVLDVSNGPATGMVVLNDLMTQVPEISPWEPIRKDSVVLSGSSEMIKRAKLILEEQGDSQTRLMSTVPTSTKYDLIILNHQLLKDQTRFPHQIDQNVSHFLKMLSPGGHIVILERGTPTGFETVARARQIMLKGTEKDEMAILAPFTHRNTCPLQVNNLNYYKIKSNRLNFCSFQKLIQRPKYSIELKKGKLLALPWDNEDRRKLLNLRGSGRPQGKNNEIVNYTYLIGCKSLVSKFVNDMKWKWPRIISPPIKKKGHVILNVITFEGKIENWIVPRSMSKEIYHDARKAKWGDLWGLDAKTKIPIRKEIDYDHLKKMEKERVYKLKKLERLKQEEMKERLTALDEISSDQSHTQANIDESAEVYKHYYEQRHGEN